jgi:ribonuclease P protein component
MLPKEFRLHKDKDIKRLAKIGQTFFLPEFIVKYQKQSNQDLKIGFVVSTKVDKRAVVRNKLKRQMREAMHNKLKDIKKGYFLLIIAKKKALDLDAATTAKQLEFALKKIKCL